MSVFDSIAAIADHVGSAITETVKWAPEPGAPAGETPHGLELPDSDGLPTFSQSLGPSSVGQSASATIDAGGGGIMDWLLGPSETPLKAKTAFDDFDSDKFIPPEMRAKIAAERDFQRELERDTGRDPNQDVYRRSGFRVGQEYTDEAPTIDRDAEVNLETEQDRIAALAGFTQNYKDESGFEVGGADTENPGANRCGATSLLGGAMLAEGNAGVQAMIDMVAADPDTAKMYGGLLGDVTKKIAAGETLTQDDLRLVQSGLHDHLRAEHQRMGFDPSEGVDGAVIQDTIKSNPRLREMFEQNNLSVGFVDTDGEKPEGAGHFANHFVLQIGETEGRSEMVYDPFSREGGQIVDKSGQVADYRRARAYSYTP